MMTHMKETQHIVVCMHRAYDETVYTLEAQYPIPTKFRDLIDTRHFDSLEVADDVAACLNKLIQIKINTNKDWYEVS